MTATVYVVRDDKVLLHLHKKYHSLFPLGGHMLPGEFPQQTAVREAFEESGLHITLFHPEQTLELGAVQQLCMPVQMYRENVGGSPENIDFIFCATAPDEPLCPQQGESGRFRWMTREQILAEPSLQVHIRSTALYVLDVMKCSLRNETQMN